MTEILHSVAQADTPANVEVPNTTWGFAMWLVGRLGANIVFAIVLGFAAKQMYEDNRTTNEARYNDFKVHQVEMMAYLTNRNDGDMKRAIADAELARSLMALSDSIARLNADMKQAQTAGKP